MDIKRIDTYHDSRFSQKVLFQHGCFLADNNPYEVEIISDRAAVIRGINPEVYAEIIDAFRFYTPHITLFYDKDGKVVKEFSPVRIFSIMLDQIQPSQFYVDRDKVAAVSSFIRQSDDIIIPVLPYRGKYISLDGHTRLYYAVLKGWKSVRAVIGSSDDWVYAFVDEAKRRNICTPGELRLISHSEYEQKWNSFCDEFFAGKR